MRLLIAEDETEMARALCAVLRHHNYSVDTVDNGTDALDWGRSSNYDGIILDIMMPGLDGLEVLRRLRDEGISTPVLMLTAKSELDDKITGLDAGADDYLSKPFAMGELLARIRAMTRRRENFTPNMLAYGDLSLDRASFTLSCREKSERLGNREYQMMEMLMESRGRVIPTELFMQRIWGYDTDAEINVVWVYISYLRKKLVALGSSVEIRATRGVGYMISGGESK
ncbi:MAG: response regulator transcription factor [Clostridia bacterium]|nr:response regulator transcription factor [Clostridia bacterium]